MTCHRITAGFMPLLDSLLLVMAREKGFAEAEGIELHLVKESSWANIRDRAALGHFDVAQMLAPMPIAASLGLTPLATQMVVPVTLGLGNNGITVSEPLWQAMAERGAPADLDATATGAALREVVGTRAGKLRFGVVHQTSSHNYELRYWLAASGIDPENDVEIVVLPPQYLPDALGSGGIDGYCVGEPWNSYGVTNKGARLVTVKHKIWRNSPDKVMAMRAEWADANPQVLAALVRAIVNAGIWASDGNHHAEMATIMAQPHYLAAPADIIVRALSGQLELGGGVSASVPDHFIPSEHAANFPWKSHALWYYSQMVRWGEATHSDNAAAIAAACFRPDLYRQAIAGMAVSTPQADSKNDAGFFDGRTFDPAELERYIAAQKQR
jgi:two-component system, oxyanion-binding sensor